MNLVMTAWARTSIWAHVVAPFIQSGGKRKVGGCRRSGAVKERKISLTTVGIAYVGPLVGYNRVGG